MSSSSWETTLCLVRQPVVGSGSRRGRILVPFPWIDSVITGRSEIVTPTNSLGHQCGAVVLGHQPQNYRPTLASQAKGTHYRLTQPSSLLSPSRVTGSSDCLK